MVNLPTNIVVANILSRLPVKTLIRITSVCKSWFSLLSNPEFINMHNQFRIMVKDSFSHEQSSCLPFKDDLNEFIKNFVKSVSDSEDVQEMYGPELSTNYLDNKGLLDLTCQYVADYIKDKSVEEIRELFNIVNDLTEGEETVIRRALPWAFE